MKIRILSILLVFVMLFTSSSYAISDDDVLVIEQAKQELDNGGNTDLAVGRLLSLIIEGNLLEELEIRGNKESALSLKESADNTLTALRQSDVGKILAAANDLYNKIKEALEIADNKTANMHFEDVAENAWYYNAVKHTVDKGIFKGTDSTHFSPETDITRGMFLALMERNFKKDEIKYPAGFDDVSETAYYADGVNWAKEKNILFFIDDDKFLPDKPITREELVTVLRGCMAESGKDAANTTNPDFSDAEQISEWAQEAVSWAVENGAVNGFDDGSFRPASTATRAQAAQIFLNIEHLF